VFSLTFNFTRLVRNRHGVVSLLFPVPGILITHGTNSNMAKPSCTGPGAPFDQGITVNFQLCWAGVCVRDMCRVLQEFLVQYLFFGRMCPLARHLYLFAFKSLAQPY